MDQQQKAERIEAYIRSYQQLFEEKGYCSNGHNGKPDPSSMQSTVRAAFERFLYAEQNKEVQFGSRAVNVETGESFEFRFRFEYEPEKVTISLRTLILDGNEQMLIIRPEVNSGFPAITELIAIHLETRDINRKSVYQNKNVGRKGPRL